HGTHLPMHCFLSYYSSSHFFSCFFFFNDTATTEIYTLSLHDALPISGIVGFFGGLLWRSKFDTGSKEHSGSTVSVIGDDEESPRSEEHTSELQSRENLVCRLLLEKKKKTTKRNK